MRTLHTTLTLEPRKRPNTGMSNTIYCSIGLYYARECNNILCYKKNVAYYGHFGLVIAENMTFVFHTMHTLYGFSPFYRCPYICYETIKISRRTCPIHQYTVNAYPIAKLIQKGRTATLKGKVICNYPSIKRKQ